MSISNNNLIRAGVTAFIVYVANDDVRGMLELVDVLSSLLGIGIADLDEMERLLYPDAQG